jgi:hypothetical protein
MIGKRLLRVLFVALSLLCVANAIGAPTLKPTKSLGCTSYPFMQQLHGTHEAPMKPDALYLRGGSHVCLQ